VARRRVETDLKKSADQLLVIRRRPEMINPEMIINAVT
jgi:hypothetical protein